MKPARLIFATVIMLQCLLCCQAAVAGYVYKLHDLGPNGGGCGCDLKPSINNPGQVAAYDWIDDHSYAYVWQNGVKEYLPDAGYGSMALSVESDVVVGYMFPDVEYGCRAMNWKDNTASMLPAASSDNGIFEFAVDINSQGIIVGVSGHEPSFGRCKPVQWSGNSVSVLPLGDATYGAAYAINDSGIAVGWTAPYSYYIGSTPSMWINGELILLGGLSSLAASGKAFDVNDAGHVVGWSYTDYVQSAFYWVDGIMRPLQVDSPYYQHSGAFGINNKDQIVGWISQTSGTHAALWQEGALSDLNDLVDMPDGYTLTEAWDINDSGQILVSAHIYDSESNSYSFQTAVLTPVPEPPTILALVLGLCGARFTVGKRRRSIC